MIFTTWVNFSTFVGTAVLVPEFYNGKEWTVDLYGRQYAPCTADLVYHAQVTISATEVMIFGGNKPNGVPQNQVVKFDFKTNQWSPLASLTNAQRT